VKVPEIYTLGLAQSERVIRIRSIRICLPRSEATKEQEGMKVGLRSTEITYNVVSILVSHHSCAQVAHHIGPSLQKLHSISQINLCIIRASIFSPCSLRIYVLTLTLIIRSPPLLPSSTSLFQTFSSWSVSLPPLVLSTFTDSP
jgi:hypothetical protein